MYNYDRLVGDKMIGRVIEIYIPEDYNNGRKISYLDSNKVGFKVEINHQIKDFIVRQNNDNSLIHVDDLVKIEMVNIENKDNYFVYKLGDSDE